MLRNRKAFFFVVLLLTTASCALVAFMVVPSARDLLVDAVESIETVQSGHAIVDVSADLPEQTGSASVEVWGQKAFGPEGEPAFRAEVLSTSMGEGTGATIVSDGVQFWAYNPAENLVVIGTFADLAERAREHSNEFEGPEEFDPESLPFDMDELPFDINDLPFDPENPPESPEEFVDLLLTYFDAERIGVETMGGQDAYKLRLIPIAEQMPEEVRAIGGLVNVWVSTNTSVPLGAEFTGSAVGGIAITTQLVEVNIDLDPAIFTFVIPEGAEVVNIVDLIDEYESEEHGGAAALESFDAPVLAPSELPEGASLVGSFEQEGIAVQRYSLLQGRSFTVAQGPPTNAFDMPETTTEAEVVEVQGAMATLYSDGERGRSLLTWTVDGVQYWIGGDVTSDEALAIANSLSE
jgi:hypothetical protein